ncbi:MAG TPA: hypothetical protein VM432_14570, partial [Bdellovibrionales bacterium]|nr:hypothetical protein [Bdellovibrionales bacterium]
FRVSELRLSWAHFPKGPERTKSAVEISFRQRSASKDPPFRGTVHLSGPRSGNSFDSSKQG